MEQRNFRPGDWISYRGARSPASSFKLVVGVGPKTITYADESGSANTVPNDCDVAADPYCRGYTDTWLSGYQFASEGQSDYRWLRINICRSSLVIAQLQIPQRPALSTGALSGSRMHLYLHRSQEEKHTLDMPSIDLRISDCLLPAREGEPLIVLGDLLGAPPTESECISRDASVR